MTLSPEFRAIGMLVIEVFGVAALTLFIGLLPRIKELKPVQFKYPQREAKYAALVAVGALIIAAIIFWPALSRGATAPNIVEYYKQLMYAGLGAALLAFGLLLYRQQPFRSIGWNQQLTSTAIQFGILVILLLLFLLGKLSRLSAGIPEEITRTLLWLLVAAAALETVFRGYVQPRLESLMGFVPAWLIAVVTFTAVHLISRWGTPQSELVPAIGVILVRSLLAGWIYKRCPHLLAPTFYIAAATWVSLF